MGFGDAVRRGAGEEAGEHGGQEVDVGVVWGILGEM